MHEGSHNYVGAGGMSHLETKLSHAMGWLHMEYSYFQCAIRRFGNGALMGML